ncbi:MAG TPA: hypothetical protein PKA83_01095, partial [Pirellulaceae bacterium]|nr:hypothetical protein [Pirellulaceae bacterium]
QQGIAPSVVDADGNRVEQFEPGLIAYARGGKDIRFNQPSATGGYGEYKRADIIEAARRSLACAYLAAADHGTLALKKSSSPAASSRCHYRSILCQRRRYWFCGRAFTTCSTVCRDRIRPPRYARLSTFLTVRTELGSPSRTKTFGERI